MPTARQRMTWILVALIAIPLIVLFFTIDDWSRDLTTNVAETSVDAADTGLRPLATTSTFDQVSDAAEAIGRTQTDWEFVDAKPSATGGVIRLVHMTRLLRFRDDVTLAIDTDADGQSMIHMRSASRIGKGDFGQNPRNIRQLRRLLKEKLKE